MPKPTEYQFDLPATGRPELFSLGDQFFPGIKESWPKCTSKRIFHPIDGIRAVVIHATAGSSSAGAVSVMHAGKASFHWLVPDEDEDEHGEFVWACAPETLAAFHVQNSKSHPAVNGGATRVNHWSLGIEVVNSQGTSDQFSDWQIAATARIVRYCWAKYPNLVHVVSHARLDPSRRSDPGVNFPWEAFQKQVLESAPESVPPLVAAAARSSRARIFTPEDLSGCCLP